ncbi:MAG TPA: AgmX/PglI C-terminal domain-containing protein [Kofleriaceae bacterium]|nr:AgmX/PglI C-terminal domain-containing protein [Kofleriaceae bacterium]
MVAPADDVVAGAGAGTHTAVLPSAQARARVFDPSDPSMSVPAARAPVVAIVVLLVLDAGLATAGALLMKAGLANTGTTATTTTVMPDAGGAATMTTTSTTTSPSPSPSTSPTTTTSTSTSTSTSEPGHVTHAGSGTPTPGTGSGTASDVNGVVSDLFGKHPDAAIAVVTPKGADAAIAVSVPPDAAIAVSPPDASGPVDPYGSIPDAGPTPPDATAEDDQHTTDLAGDVERKSAQSQARFTHCYEDAAKAYTPDQPLAGEVDIAFRVMPTGEVQNAAAVKNTTGSDKLADCLSSVISSWSFPPSNLTEAAVFVRPFRFDGH